MRYYPNDGFATDVMSQEAEIPGNNFNEFFELINEDLASWKDRYTWLRKSSHLKCAIQFSTLFSLNFYIY